MWPLGEWVNLARDAGAAPQGQPANNKKLSGVRNADLGPGGPNQGCPVLPRLMTPLANLVVLAALTWGIGMFSLAGGSAERGQVLVLDVPLDRTSPRSWGMPG